MVAEISTAPEKKFPATVRDISEHGMGFLHREPIGLQEVAVNVLIDGDELRVRVVVDWCRQCDNGMFMSGGHFLSVSKSRDSGATIGFFAVRST